jgi:hypothetical protein
MVGVLADRAAAFILASTRGLIRDQEVGEVILVTIRRAVVDATEVEGTTTAATMGWRTTMEVEEDLVASVAMKVAGVVVGGNQATSTPVILGRKPNMASPGPWVATRRLVDSITLWGGFLRPPRWRGSKHSLGGPFHSKLVVCHQLRRSEAAINSR